MAGSVHEDSGGKDICGRNLGILILDTGRSLGLKEFQNCKAILREN